MILWIMVIAQMLGWAYFSYRGGKVSDIQFYIFTASMLLGQLATGIETCQMAAWRSFLIQVFFFIFTAVGGIQRYRKARN